LVLGVLFWVNDIKGQSASEEPSNDYHQEYYDNDEGQKVNIFEIDFHFNIPVNNFAQNYNGVLVGPGIAFYRQRKFEKPEFWGVRIKYHLMDRGTGRIDDVIDGEFVDINRTVASSIVQAEFAYRIYPQGNYWIFDPYVELGLGGAVYYTSVSDQVVQFEDSIHLGTHVSLSGSAVLNFRVGYQSGTIVTYDTETDDNFVDPLDNFELNTSSIESINLMLGVSFPF